MATHDLTKKEWGNDYAFTSLTGDGAKGTMTVWSSKFIEIGDFLIVRNGSGTTRYKVDSVRRMANPPDQMFLDVTFAPRSPEPEPEPEMSKSDALLEFSKQFLALDQNQLIEWMHGVIGMYREYIEAYGFAPEAAESAAILEVIGGAEAIVEMDKYGKW